MISGQAITFQQFGDLNSVLRETNFEIDPTNLKDDQIVLQTLATSINPSDKVQIRGVYAKGRLFDIGDQKQTYIAGNEGLFRVTHVGPSSKLKVNDWVIANVPGFGTWRSGVISTDKEVLKVSDDNDSLTFEQAATISVNPPTAIQLLEEIPDWKENDWLIQNMGNSQVSRFVTQIARHLNIKTISVVRSGKSEEEIQQLYDLGATKVITEEEFAKPSFFAGLAELTNNGNIRLALDSLGGPTTELLMKSLSHSGTMITYGSLLSQNISYPGGLQLLKNLTVKPYWLTYTATVNPPSRAASINKAIEYYKTGVMKSIKFDEVVYEGGSLLKSYLEGINKAGKQVVIYKKNL